MSRPSQAHPVQLWLLAAECRWGAGFAGMLYVSACVGMMDAAQHWRDSVEWSGPVQGLPSDSFPSPLGSPLDKG